MISLITKLLILFFILICVLTFFLTVRNKNNHGFVLFIYTLIFAYTVGQGIYYANNYPGTSPDETAHISYIYYLDTYGDIIPHFENMHLFNAAPMKWSDENYIYIETSYNYLCHPPLYYQIMRLAGGFSSTDTEYVIHIDKLQLRYFSMIIGCIGLLILLYIGFSRIDKSQLWLHLLYATAVTSVPLLSFELCAVTNDVLAIVTGSLCILGLIRFCEGKRGYLTYTLIAMGITASLLTKMTTAMLCVIMSLIVLLITIIKEHNVLASFKKEFWLTTPIYLIALGYYGIIYARYGVLQPSLELISSTEYLQSTTFYTAPEYRTAMTMSQYIGYYFTQFFKSWSGIVADVILAKVSIWDKFALASEALWFIPVLLFIPTIKKSADKLALPIISGWIACIITLIIQIKSAYGTFLTRGYLGGFNSRYYFPLMAIFGLAAVFVFRGIRFKNNIASKCLIIIALLFSFALFMGGLPFCLIYFG